MKQSRPVFAVRHFAALVRYLHMEINKPYSFSIKNVFCDIMDLWLFIFM